MKKIVLPFLVSILTLSSVGNPVLAANDKGNSDTNILKKVQKIDKESNVFELVSLQDIPKDTATIKFKNVNEFKKYVNELEKNSTLLTSEVSSVSSVNNSVTTLSAKKSKVHSTTDRLTVIPKVHGWNPLQSAVYSSSITVDVKYKYTGSKKKKNKKFKKITKVRSHNFGVPADWHQTSYNKKLYGSNKGVKLTLHGYNLLGVSVGGQPAGMKVNQSVTFKYKLGGKKTIIEKY